MSDFGCFPAVAGHAHAWILDWRRVPGVGGCGEGNLDVFPRLRDALWRESEKVVLKLEV